MTTLEREKSRHIEAGFYKGTPVEVMTYATVANLTEEEKFRICYANWVENFFNPGEEVDIDFNSYKIMTRSEFEDAKENGGYDGNYYFMDFLNDLTYSYVNEIWGTPMSLV